MFVALGCSVVFTLFYSTIAAHSRRAERVMVPLLDVLQSVPLLRGRRAHSTVALHDCHLGSPGACGLGRSPVLALLLFGYVKGRFTGAGPVRSAFQTALIGGLAAGAAFAVARAIS